MKRSATSGEETFAKRVGFKFDPVFIEDVLRDYRTAAPAVRQAFFLKDEWCWAWSVEIWEAELIGVQVARF